MPCPSSVIQGGPILLYTDKANSPTHPLTGVLEFQIGAKVDGTGGTTTNEICGFAWRIETRGA